MLRKIFMVLIAVVFLLGITKLSLAMMCGSHGEKQTSHRQLAQAHTEHEQGTTVAAKEGTLEEAVNVGNKICPVMGEKVAEGEAAVTYEYEGKIYNFCCPMCVDSFKSEPQKYIDRVAEDLKNLSEESGMTESTDAKTQY